MQNDYPGGGNNAQKGLFASYGTQNSSSQIFGRYLASGTRYEIDMNRNQVSVDGALRGSLSEMTFTCPASMTVGAVKKTATTYDLAAYRLDVYSCQIWDDGELVGDFIPCVRNDVPQFYDKVTKKHFESAGTVAFIAGGEQTEVDISSETYGSAVTAAYQSPVSIEVEAGDACYEVSLAIGVGIVNQALALAWGESDYGDSFTAWPNRAKVRAAVEDGDIRKIDVSAYGVQPGDAFRFFLVFADCEFVPYDATCDYLVFATGAYLLTDVVPDKNSHVWMKLTSHGGTATECYFGAWSSWNSRSFAMQNDYVGGGSSATKGLFASYGSTAGSNMGSYFRANTTHTIDLNRNVLTVDDGDEAKGGYSKTLTETATDFTCPCPMAVGAINQNGTIPTPTQTVDIHGCKIWANDVLVHDYRPCVQGGVVKFYDAVTKQCYGSSTATAFSAGGTVRAVDYDSAVTAGSACYTAEVEGPKPTDSTGVKGEATAYSWGETYKLTDNAKDYTIVKVTKAGESVAVTVPAETPIEMLVVGGGGAGSDYGSNRGAGGGAGGLVWKSVIFAEETELTLTVGAGGTASGANGTDSTVAAGGELLVQAFGGGGGGTANVGGAGGSGGGGVNKGAGGSALNSGGDLATGIGAFGYAGGNAGTGTAPGGGGGAGGAGSNGASNSPGGDGGPGLVYAITGVKEGYAGGGGGAPNSNGGAVTIDDVVITLGGYGYSSAHNDKASHNAQVANSGSGGGGASGGNFGDGADGIIVLRYIPPVDTRTPVDKPEITGARFAYDGADHKPVITPEEGWTVSYSAAEWVAIGTYAVTITLEKGYKWSDNTTAPLVIAYTVYDPNAVVRVAGEPTTTLGVVYRPSLTMTDWGYRYTLVDRETADAFTVIVVTNARQNVALDIPALATVETLVVGGGGAGGEVDNSSRARGGGGGAGGLVWGKYFYPTAKTVTLRVGAGGSVAGESGGDSTMEISGVPLITAHGGGGGANGSIAAKSGGSGGGGAPSPSVAAGAAEGGHPGEYANAGGNANGTNAAGGGGGGGGAASGKDGGAGCAYAITGENRGYAAGGGGSPSGVGGSAAEMVIGGYGFGGMGASSAATAGAANTGSGGGGAGAGQTAGTGASGIIVLRYANVNQKFELKENAQGELEAIPVPGLIFYLFR